MESEEEGQRGDNSQSRILKRMKNIRIKHTFGSWEPSIWTFSGVIVVFVILLLTIMLLLPFGINPINRRAATVRSNSMKPTFERGDIVFVQEVDPHQIEEGDVIVLQVPDQYEERYSYPPLIVHRVNDIRYDHLFDMGLSEDEEYLDFDVEQSVPEDLKTRFEEENYYLSNQAKMTPPTDGESWITVRGEKEYRLKETDGQLRIYDAEPAFETKGDAEDQPDPFLTPQQNIIGEYSGSQIPYMGLMFMFANTPIGMATLSLAFVLIVIGVYFPWHIDIKEERTRAMSTLGGGLDALHRRLTEMEDAMGGAASAVGDAASGLIVSRNIEGKIGAIKKESEGEMRPDNIMMKRGDSGPEDIGKDFGKPSSGKEEVSEKEIDSPTMDELHKEFQKGEISVDEFIDIRKDMSPEKDKEEIDPNSLNQLYKKFQRGEISVEEFIKKRKESKR